MNLAPKLLQEIWGVLQSSQIPGLGFLKYLILALMVAVEGPVATLLGAAAASAGFMRIALVFIAAGTGNLSADAFWYSLGYAGKQEWLLRYGRWIGLRSHHLARLQEGMERHAPKILLIAKLTSGFIIPSLIAAGLARVPWKRWFLPIAAGEVVWTGSLVLLGYYAAQTITQVQKDVRVAALVAGLIFLLALIWLISRWLRQKGAGYETKLNDEFQKG
jgi:membrane protein DedA with SNARE-associated domain